MTPDDTDNNAQTGAQIPAHLSGPDNVAGVVGHMVDVLIEAGLTPSGNVVDSPAAICDCNFDNGHEPTCAIVKAHNVHREAGKQRRPGMPTTSILNTEGQAISWEVVEENARVIGIANTANKFKIKPSTIYARSRSHKWKGIPDARSVALVEQGSSEELQEAPGDFTRRITRHRERVFKTASDSLGKVKRIKIRGARDYEIVDKIARRAAGINDDDVATANVLIHINEAIETHEAEKPIEAHEVIPCDTVPLPDLPNESQIKDALIREAGKQKLLVRPAVQVQHPIVSSETLNAGDSSRRQFVLPGPAAPVKQ